jgi:trimeric autotransporter adhesin
VSAHARHLCRSLTIACAVVAIALLAAVMDASAYYSAGGSTSARAIVGTLAAPTISSATFSGAGAVTLSWSTVTAPASGSVTYYVSRDGGAASAACPSAAAPTSATSCTDTGLSAGTHAYTVTAVWRTWTSTSAGARATVSYGTATQLVFTTQPGGGATGGTAFPTQPVVAARDAGGNTVLDYAATVTLSIFRGGAAGATLSGCAGTLRNGVTTFSGCKIDKAGLAYVLRASDRAVSANSTSFDVSVGAAAQLLFTTQPGGGATGGTTFPTQPVVTAQDAGGNVVTAYAGPVTLSILSGGAAGATLSGCVGTLRGGVTTFAGCKIDKAGTAYVLRASDTRVFGDSAAFDVTPGVATRLLFSTQPAGATGGSAFTTQPVVTAQDAGGNTATSYAGTVTLAIASGGTAGATLSGCSGALRSGVTTFSGCKIDKVGTNYVLQARDGTLSVTSSAFNVTAGAATRLAFTTQPGGAARNTALNPQPVVTALDAGGNVATGYAGTVTLSIAAGTGASGAALNSCSGSLSNGVTTFSGCKINKTGTGYVLQAADGALSVNSNPFDVS